MDPIQTPADYWTARTELFKLLHAKNPSLDTDRIVETPTDYRAARRELFKLLSGDDAAIDMNRVNALDDLMEAYEQINPAVKFMTTEQLADKDRKEKLQEASIRRTHFTEALPSMYEEIYKSRR